METLLTKHGSRPYNPDIANVFFRAGEIEAWGRGVERIISACKEAGSPAPIYRYDGVGLWTVFEFGLTTQKTTQKTTQELTDIQISIIDYLKNYPQATRKEMTRQIPNVTEDGIKYNLSRLQDIGILKRVGGRKFGHWEVLD